MNLRIENGILLKPYLAPYTRKDGGGHRLPKGWTPDRSRQPLRMIFEELRQQFPDRPEFLVWRAAENAYGKRLIERRRPYPGWIPLPSPHSGAATDKDKAISRAYRELFGRMNPVGTRVKLGGAWSGPKTVVPPDGDYIFRRGEMRLVRIAPAVVKAEIEKVVSEALG